MAKKIDKSTVNLTASFKKFLTWFSLMVGKKWFLGIIIVIFLFIQSWLIYQYVFLPLRQPVPLPSGISEVNPSINIDLLRTINSQRADRVDRQIIDYSNAGQIFIHQIKPKSDE